MKAATITDSHRVTEGIVEHVEDGTLILSPSSGRTHRRILHVNSYGGRAVWDRIKNGLIPSHQLLGCLQLVRMGYEIALPEPVKHFDFRRPIPHDLKLVSFVKSWLGRDGIMFCGHTILYWIPLLRMLGSVRCPIVSVVYAREELDFARAHAGVIALTRAGADQARKLAPQAKVASLGWGVDLDFVPKLPYDPQYFFSCGIANRDFRTLSAAARISERPMRVIYPGSPEGSDWSPNVTLFDGGAGWLTDNTKRITLRDLIRDHFPRSAATLIIMQPDEREYTANGFTNLMEAMALGQPVIVTRTGALPSEIDVEKVGCGLYVPPEDPHALAKAIETLAEDPERAEGMGAVGRKLCESHYNLDAYAQRVHTFFESL